MKKFLFIFLLALFFLPGNIQAATKPKLEVSGWIPYWRAATGTMDAMNHLDAFTELNPFGYTVKNDGSLSDLMHIDDEPWASLIKAAKAKKIRIIPTVMMSDGNLIHTLLSNGTTRRKLEDDIAALVKEKGFDGIDIDFEGKKAKTKDYFSLFLKGLYLRMPKHWVMCTIEARTPLTSRYEGTPPPDATTYANDFVAINKYCDRVRIMTYDQGSIDVLLNKARFAPYIPVADPGWVEKVMTLTAQSISKKKLSIGIATYGYEYSVTPLSEQGFRYKHLWAFNPKYALDLASSLGITPTRNGANEMSFIYIDGTAKAPDPTDQTNLNDASLVSTAEVKAVVAPGIPTGKFNILWWSDATAIKDKVDLAKKLGLRGVSIFKIDGGEDPGMWGVIK